MAKLTGQTIADSYDQLLIVNDADGISGALQAIESADTGGGASSLKISTSKCEVIPASNSTSLFEVSQADGTAVLSVDTTNAHVGIGTSGPGYDLEIGKAGTPQLVIAGFTTNVGITNCPEIRLLKSNNASLDTGDATAANEYLGLITAYGFNTSDDAEPAARIVFRQANDLDPDSVSGIIYFDTSDSDDAASPTTRMTIDNAGKVGIGDDSPSSTLTVSAADGAADNTSVFYCRNNEATAGRNYGAYISGGTNSSDKALYVQNSAANADYLVVRGDGNIGIGLSAPDSNLHIIATDSDSHRGLRVIDLDDEAADSSNVLSEFCYLDDGNLGGAFFIRFMESDSAGGIQPVGGITATGDTTTFATSSDYRLKEDLKDMVDATGTINELKLYDFKWKKSGKRRDGVVAHEADAIYPQAVIGEKDAMSTSGVYYRKRDTIPEGKKIGDVYGEKEVIAPQMVDYPSFIPLLLKSIQELSAKVTALENA